MSIMKMLGRSGPPLGQRWRVTALAAALVGTGLAAGVGDAQAAITCTRTITANVVALDNAIVNNRLGASNVNGMIFALARDVVNDAAGNPRLRDDKRPRPLVLRVAAGDCLNVTLTNRLRPLPNPLNAPVDLDVNAQGAPVFGQDPNPSTANGLPQITTFVDEQVADRRVGLHANGMQLRGSIASDGSFVGRNDSSLTCPQGATCLNGEPNSRVYQLYAEKEGVFQVVSHGALVGSDANQGNVANGLFGQIIVEPRGARIYRNTVTDEEMRLASRTATATGPNCPQLGPVITGNQRQCLTTAGQPILNYEATYPNVAPWNQEGKAGVTILNMIQGNQIVHSEVDAVVAGPNADGTFPASTYPHEAAGRRNPAYPNRLEPFRDFAQVWHDEVGNAQAYPGFYSAGFRAPGALTPDPLTPVFAYLLKGVRDKFLINYGSGGIGTEILSNRLGVGPMHDCLNCAYEEFFLTHFTVGEIGQLVDIPANQGLETITPTNVLNILLAIKAGDLTTLSAAEQAFVAALGPKATKALYPGDPANINHSYVGDFVKFRNTHNGFEQHVFHLHNHQWLFNPNDDNSNYLDAQGIGPGMGYTYEIANGGSGNRNKSAGDAIYHCHFYPHFAQGMWYMWRIHDVLETGTRLAVSNGANGFHTVPYALQDGTPAAGARALPDGELVAGTPIPAVVPLPGKALPPMPSATVTVKAVDRNGDGIFREGSQAIVDRTGMRLDGTWNPGYPFWIAGIACEDDGTVCEQGIVGQRPTTPPLDMVTKTQAQALVNTTAPFSNYDAAMKSNFVNLAGDYTQMHGGLPRHAMHGVAAGGAAGPTIAGIVSPVDLTKFVEKAKPAYFPEGGTDIERAAMATHARLNTPSFRVLPNGTVQAANFVLNGRPAVPGSVYSDPCRDDAGNAVNSNGVNRFNAGGTLTSLVDLPTGPFGAYNPRIYRGANIQYDAVLNKVGYHYPQQRIVSLWEDALPVIDKNKPGEPLVMRLNTFDCAMYHHTNLVPETFEMDDYQLRTPTDIIGQHIHLPKWDLTTTDGAANGWNYEDGTLAAGAIRERIHAINKFNDEHVCEGHAAIVPAAEELAGAVIKDVSFTCPAGTANAGNAVSVPHLTELPHPFFGATGPGNVDWRGARITLQRWFADPLLNVQNVDRGLGIIFTHDHYGPSTFQQIGLYSTVLVEPARSTWAHSETGRPLGCTTGNNATRPTATNAVNTAACRYDGGPTSWQAIINTAATGPGGDIDNDGKNDSFREFYFEYTDFQHAYEAGVYVGAGPRGEHNGQADEADYIAGVPIIGGALRSLFYPTLHEAPALGEFPAGLDTFRFSIAPPLILPVFPIFPDLTVEKQVTLANGAFSQNPVAAPGFELNGFVRACIQRPCPTSIDFLEPGVFVVNYRNEPMGLRVFDPNRAGPDGKPGAQAAGRAGDLAFAFSSDPTIVRAIPAMNRMPVQGDVAQAPANANILPATNRPAEGTMFPPHINASGFSGSDPFTPMLRTYSGDRVRIKAQAGGDEEEHSVSIHGVKWTQSGSGHGRAPNSGWRNQQAGGISEQFTIATPVFMDGSQQGNTADYLYMMDAHQDGVWNGNWGLMRNYNTLRTDLAALPNNVRPVQILNRFAFQDFPNGRRQVCPLGARNVTFNVSAVLANDVLDNPFGALIPAPGEPASTPIAGPDTGMLAAGTPDFQRGQLPQVTVSQLHAGGPLDPNGGTLVYNKRPTPVTGFAQQITVDESGPLHDPTAIMYVLNSDIGANGKLLPNAPREPLALRVNAGDCVTVNLTNRLPADRAAPDLPNYNQIRQVVKRDRMNPEGSTVFGVNLIAPSSNVGFHTQLLEYDVTRSDGTNVGVNPVQTAAPGTTRTYTFYAGDLRLAELPQIGNPNQFNLDAVLAQRVEFGGANILPADRMKQPQKGLFGQVIVEPFGAAVSFPDPTTRMAADVTAPAGDGLPAVSYRDFALVWQKMMNYRYRSGNAVQNESEEGPGTPENPPHTILNGANYRAEPTFFRFGIPPLSAAGGAACSLPITAPKPIGPGDATCFGSVVNAGSLFSNVLTGNADPETPIFVARAGQPARIHLTHPNSSNRGTTFALHGHLWARDPYVSRDRDAAGFPRQLAGQVLGGVPSIRIANNPMSFFLGSQESVIGSSHYSFVLPSAGGGDAIVGDYLFRDTASAGMGGGAWGMLRVQ